MTEQAGTTNSMVISYKYGLMAPVDWDQDCDEELARQIALWNRLVEIENIYRRHVQALEDADTDVMSWKTKRSLLENERRSLLEEQGSNRRALPSDQAAAEPGGATTPTDRLAEVNIGLDDARRFARVANREHLRLLNVERYKSVKEARQASGLFWSNYNAVIDRYEVARRHTSKKGVSMRLHVHNGSGHVTNQIQGGISFHDLEAGTHSQVRIGPRPPGMKHKCGASLTATVHRRGGVRRTVTWPIILHRRPPEGSIVKSVVVRRHRRSDRWVWSAVFVCVCAANSSRQAGSRIAVNIGWRRTPDGIRVASVLSEHDAEARYVIFPERLIQGARLCNNDSSERDTDLRAMVDLIRGINFNETPSTLAYIGQVVKELDQCTPTNLAHLVAEWRAFDQNWQPDILALLEEWARRDRRRWHNREERRAWITDARKYYYQQEIQTLFNGASEILINAHNMSRTAQISEHRVPPPAAQARFVVAPSIFRRILMDHARKEGIKITVLNRHHDTCVSCRNRLLSVRRADLWWRCNTCGNIFDQDEHYCRLLLS